MITLKKMNKFNLTKGDLIGGLEGMPIVVVEQMLENQLAQGNPMDIKVFQNKVDTTARFGGFDWNKTPQGVSYWSKIINKKDYSDVETPVEEEWKPKLYERVIGTSITGKTKREYVFLGTIPGAMYPNMVCTPSALEAFKKGQKILDVIPVRSVAPAPPAKVRLTLKDISEGKGVGIDPNLIEIVK